MPPRSHLPGRSGLFLCHARKKRIGVKEPEIIEKIGEENTEERRRFRKPRRRLGKGETPKPHAEKEEVKIDKKNNKTGNVTSLRKIFEKEEHEKKTKKHEEEEKEQRMGRNSSKYK